MNDVNSLTHNIIGCAMKIHNKLGSGFQEVIYQRALAIELQKLGVSFQREFEMSIMYDDELIGTRRVDFYVEDELMVELKATEELKESHKAQAINYLEAYDVKHGLLINFGSLKIQVKRVYNKKYVKPDTDFKSLKSSQL